MGLTPSEAIYSTDIYQLRLCNNYEDTCFLTTHTNYYKVLKRLSTVGELLF
jgi:hypothetical protein